jgi:hypothetical protein
MPRKLPNATASYVVHQRVANGVHDPRPAPAARDAARASRVGKIAYPDSPRVGTARRRFCPRGAEPGAAPLPTLRLRKGAKRRENRMAQASLSLTSQSPIHRFRALSPRAETKTRRPAREAGGHRPTARCALGRHKCFGSPHPEERPQGASRRMRLRGEAVLRDACCARSSGRGRRKNGTRCSIRSPKGSAASSIA